MIEFNRNHREYSKIGINNTASKEVNKQKMMTKSIYLDITTNPNLKLLSIKNMQSKLKKLGKIMFNTKQVSNQKSQNMIVNFFMID